MKLRRLWLVCGFVLMLSFGFVLTRGDAQPNTVQKIADGVWFREGDLKNLGHCNNIIIEMKDYLIVVDANFPSGARLALEDARKVSSKPVKYVFDTHHHGDHAYGNAVWTKQGAITLAYVGVAEEMKRYEPARWQETAKTRKDVAEMNLNTAEPPKQTFSKTPFLLKDGSREVQFHFLGWAHTRGDGFVFLPKEKILCTGDAVANGPYNYTADGNIKNWPNVVAAAEKLGAQKILPGHGSPGGPEVLKGQREFFVELAKAASAAVKQGKSLDDVVQHKDGKLVSASLTVPDSVKHWVGDSFPAQAQDAYNEAKTGKAAGSLPHK